MDLSKIATNKRVLKTLCGELKEAAKRSAGTGSLWGIVEVRYILGQFKLSLTKSSSPRTSMDDILKALAARGITGSRIREKRSKYGGIWATNNYYPSIEDFFISFKNFTINARYISDYQDGTEPELRLGIEEASCPMDSQECEKMDPQAIVDQLLEFDSAVSDFRDRIWPQMQLEISKQAKIAEMAENTIEMLLKGKMAGTEIPYVIEKQKLRVKAIFDVGSKTMVEMAISHKNFAQEVDRIVATVKQLKDFISKAGMQIRIKAITASNSRYIRWQNAGSDE